MARDQEEDKEFKIARFDCHENDKARELCGSQGVLTLFAIRLCLFLIPHNVHLQKIWYPGITLYRKGRSIGELPYETDATEVNIYNWARPAKQSAIERFERKEKEWTAKAAATSAKKEKKDL